MHGSSSPRHLSVLKYDFMNEGMNERTGKWIKK